MKSVENTIPKINHSLSICESLVGFKLGPRNLIVGSIVWSIVVVGLQHELYHRAEHHNFAKTNDNS